MHRGSTGKQRVMKLNKSDQQPGRGRRRGRVLGLIACLALGLGLAGCSSPTLQGKVVEGVTPGVVVVDADDPMLDQPGLAGAMVDVTLDPGRMTAAEQGGGISDAQGRFSVPLSSFGVGMLEYDVQVRARLRGYAPVARTLPLPNLGRKRFLIVLSPGGDAPARHPQPSNLLEDTLKLSEPFLQE